MKIEDVISLGISADSSSAARELRKLNSLLRSVKDPTDDLARSEKLLGEARRLGEISQRQYSDAMAKSSANAAKQSAAIETYE